MVWVILTSFLVIPLLYVTLWAFFLKATEDAAFKLFGEKYVEKSKFLKVIGFTWIIVVAGCCAFLCWKTFVIFGYLVNLAPKSWFPPAWR